MAKRKFAIRKTFVTTANVASIPLPVVTFDAGKLGKREFDASKLPVSMMTRFLASGLYHTLGDTGAKSAGTTVAEKFAAIDERWAANLAGEWAIARETLTPEERAARLEERVSAAWVAYKTSKTGEEHDSDDFEEFLGNLVRTNQERDPSIDRAAVVKTLSKRAELEEYLESDTGPAVEIGEM